jgi:hypothetical protein
MKKVLQSIAVITHPVFLPVFSLVLYMPFVARLDMQAHLIAAIWVGFAYLILPLLYFKVVRAIHLANPSLAERRSIFKVYAFVNAGFALVSLYILPECISFYLGAMLLHLFLWFFVYIDLKASWHTAIWSFLTMTGLMLLYNYQLVGLETTVMVLAAVLAAVSTLRYYQKAHTPLELMMGIVAGILSSSFILFF